MVWCHLMILDTMTHKANRAVDGAIALYAVHLNQNVYEGNHFTKQMLLYCHYDHHPDIW